MKKVDWNRAEILAEMYKTGSTSIYISRGETFEESIHKETWTFKFSQHPTEFRCADGVDYDIVADAFSLNILFLEEDDEDGNMAHIDFDVGVEL